VHTVKITSEKAELTRLGARAIAKSLIERAHEKYGPYFSAEGHELAILNLARRLEESIKREEQYVRIISAATKPARASKCRACEQRKIRSLIKASKSKFKACSRENCLRVLAEISELWPDFKRVPDRLWNLYIDTTGICRCGRPIAPKIVSRSPKAAHCCDEHARRWASRKSSERYTQKAAERRALAEAL
jgi:thiamine kinase-like enzyme